MSASAWLAASVLAAVTLLASCGGESPDPMPLATPSTSAAPTTPASGTPPATGEATQTPTASVTADPTPTPPATVTAEVTRTPTPSPTAAATPRPTPAIEYTELTLGEPRYQPPGYALFSLLRPCFWNCTALRVGVVRTTFEERSGELHLDNPLASLEEFGSYFDFEVGSSGELMAASLCVQGNCGGGEGVPSDDAQQELWVSRDSGDTWRNWGSVRAPAWILRVMEDDVAVMEAPPMRVSELAARVRWVRSGTVFPEPATGESVWVVGWDGDVPIWDEWGVRRHPPALSAVAPRTWSEVQTRPDGSAVWYATEVGEPLLLLAVVDAQGAVEEVYGWPSGDYVGRLVPMGKGLFAGFRMENGWGNGTDHMSLLIDLEGRTVHPLLGLPDGEEGFAEPWRAVPLTVE